MTPPPDRITYWVRFVCSFLFFGIVIAAILLRIMMRTIHEELWLFGTLWLVITLGTSHYLACKGDSGWRNLLDKFIFWR